MDAPHCLPPHVGVVVDQGHAELQRGPGITGGRRDGGYDQVEQRLQVGARLSRIQGGRARLGIGVDHREVQLVAVGAQVDEQIQHLVQRLGGAGVGAVDLVDHHDRHQPGFQRLAQHEAGLGHWPLGGVHQQQDAVDHLDDALHLAAEVGVAGGIHDVQLIALVSDGGILGHDGDAALTLQVVAVEDALLHGLPLVEDPALLQHPVHQGGLAVVDVGDDRQVADMVLPYTIALDCSFQITHRLIVLWIWGASQARYRVKAVSYT